MQNAQTKRNFLISFFSMYRNLELAAYRVVMAAEQSYAAREPETVDVAGELLIELGLPAYGYLGHYYAGLAKVMKGELEDADSNLAVASQSPSLDIQERVSLTQSLISLYKGDCEARMRLCETLKDSNSPLIAIEARRAIAVLRGLQGEHQKALLELEQIFPLVAGYKHPRLYLDTLNSYAVESTELGKFDQAEQAVERLKESPLFNHHTDWQDTARTFAERRRRSFFVAGVPDKERNAAIARIETLIYSQNPVYSAEAINAGADVIQGK